MIYVRFAGCGEEFERQKCQKKYMVYLCLLVNLGFRGKTLGVRNVAQKIEIKLLNGRSGWEEQGGK